jgi:hypothetical protein
MSAGLIFSSDIFRDLLIEALSFVQQFHPGAFNCDSCLGVSMKPKYNDCVDVYVTDEMQRDA